MTIDVERYNHWLKHGAQATPAVENLVRAFGRMKAAPAAVK